MSGFTRRKINNVKIKASKKKQIPPEFIKGGEMFETPYRNTLMLANTGSGKTNTLLNVLKATVNKRSMVFIWAGQLYQDDAWKEIVMWLKKHNIPYVLNTSLYDEDG